MKQLAGYLLKEKFKLMLLVVFSIVVVVLSLWNTSYIALVTNKTYEVLAGEITDEVYFDALKSASISMIIIMVLMAASNIASGYFAGKVAIYVVEDIRNTIYEKAMTFSLKEMNDFGVPSMITRSTGDVLSIQGALYLLLTTALPVPFLIIGGIVGVLKIGKGMVLLLIVGVILVVTIFLFLLKKTGPLYVKLMGLIDGLSRVTREGLSGIQILRALNREKWNGKRIQDKSIEIKEIATSVDLVQAIMQPCMYLIISLVDIAAVWVGAYFIRQNQLEVGDLTAFINYIFMTISGIILGAMVGITIPGAAISSQRICEVLNKEPSIKDGTGIDVTKLDNYDVNFNDVSFRYSDDAGMVIRNISFEAKQGQMTVVVGNTGCGKTTLMQLIPRLYEASEGKITIGGNDIKDMKLKELRRLIGYVPQRAFLHSGEIGYNIAYRDKNFSREIVERSADISQSLDFILGKEKGFEEWIAQGGSNFSGGQRQRLTIARALAGSPKILILDDSASALDLETGVKLRDAIRTISGDITVIFVTQRLSIIRNADKVVVMQDGEIKDVGTYEELKENSEIFKDILKSQMGA